MLLAARTDVERVIEELIVDDVELDSDVLLGGALTTLSVNRDGFIADGGGGIVALMREFFPKVVLPIVEGVSPTCLKVLLPVSESDDGGRIGMGVTKAFDSRLFPILEGGAGVLPAVPHTPIFLFS